MNDLIILMDELETIREDLGINAFTAGGSDDPRSNESEVLYRCLTCRHLVHYVDKVGWVDDSGHLHTHHRIESGRLQSNRLLEGFELRAYAKMLSVKKINSNACNTMICSRCHGRIKLGTPARPLNAYENQIKGCKPL